MGNTLPLGDFRLESTRVSVVPTAPCCRALGPFSGSLSLPAPMRDWVVLLLQIPRKYMENSFRMTTINSLSSLFLFGHKYLRVGGYVLFFLTVEWILLQLCYELFFSLDENIFATTCGKEISVGFSVIRWTDAHVITRNLVQHTFYGYKPPNKHSNELIGNWVGCKSGSWSAFVDVCVCCKKWKGIKDHLSIKYTPHPSLSWSQCLPSWDFSLENIFGHTGKTRKAPLIQWACPILSFIKSSKTQRNK